MPQKGVSLYLAFLIMTALLSMALGLSVILVSQLKIIRGMSHSVIAFYAADSGVEQALIELCSSPPCEYEKSFGDASYYVKVLSPGGEECPFLSEEITYCINSVGIYKGTRRAIQAVR